jgi:DNA-directed RNA polymerase subunit RPC12/RpoP
VSALPAATGPRSARPGPSLVEYRVFDASDTRRVRPICIGCEQTTRDKAKSNMGYRFPPHCLSCGKPMRLARSIPKLGGLPELRTIECRECGVSITEEVEAEASEMAAQSMPA